MAEYGFSEVDVLFIEIKHPDGWTFILDETDPRFFDTEPFKNLGKFTEVPVYKRYWENTNFRRFVTTEPDYVSPEYRRISRLLQPQSNPVDQISGSVSTTNGNTSCSTSNTPELEPAARQKEASPPMVDDTPKLETPERRESTESELKRREDTLATVPTVSSRGSRKSSESASVKIKAKVSRPSGIKNIGNSCYLSSSVQCLKHTKPLWDYIESNRYQADINKKSKGEIARSFGELVQTLKEDNQSVSPHLFKKVVAAYSTQFSGSEQSDAQEFLTFLIDKLHEELKDPVAGMDSEGSDNTTTGSSVHSDCDSKIKEIFYGTFRSTIQCTSCGHISLSHEPFMCISLPIEGNVDVITMTLFTRSQHLMLVSCKYDDECTDVATVKGEIQRQAIVGSLDMYLLLETGEVEVVDDSQTIGDITRHKASWQLYAIERTDEEVESLVKIDIAKYPDSILISCSSEQKEQTYALKEVVRKAFVAAAAGPLGASTRSQTQTLDFNVVEEKEVVAGSPIAYTQLELKATLRTSDLKQLWTKLPHKQIEWITRKTEENLGELQRCLDKFSNTEILHGNDRWMCPDCHEFQDAIKRIEYQKLPQVLIIHLKRFKVVGKKLRKKISTMVTFPFILLLPTVDGTLHMYNLYATLNHIGDIERGHYTAYCRNLRSRNEWLEFDDNKVKPIDPLQLETEKAYVLFYEHS